jgi:outer membrane lipoprotein-sorting protein
MRIALVFVTLLLFSSYFLIAQVKDDIIKKHLNAIGGEKNWQNIKTITSAGIREYEGASVEETRQMIPNKALRIDYKFKTRDEAISKKNYFLIIYENQGWRYLPDNLKDSIEVLSPQEINYYKAANFMSDPFLPSVQNEYKIEYLNKEFVGEKECYKFSVSGTNGQTGYIYLDAHTYLISKRVTLGADSESVIDYNDYRKINQTITVPYLSDAGYEKFTLSDIQINKPVNEQIFRPSYRK